MMLRYRITLLTFFLAKWTDASYLEKYCKNNNDLVILLQNNGYVKDPRIFKAMLKVDRKAYRHRSGYEKIPEEYPKKSFPTPLNMQAYALDHLYRFIKEGSRVLDVGSGSGYIAAVMAYMVGKTGKVFTLQPVPILYNITLKNLKKLNPAVLEDGRLTVYECNLLNGAASDGPYDAIHFGVTQPEVPKKVLEQLKNGGRMIIPIATMFGIKIYLYNKLEDGKSEKEMLWFMKYETKVKSTTEGEPYDFPHF